MQISAEIRWFWKDPEPERLRTWFADPTYHGCAAGGGPPARIDKYLEEPNQTELGIKVRAFRAGQDHDAVEIKGLVAAELSRLNVSPWCGPIELWCKWKSGRVAVGPETIPNIQKTRWLRKFDCAMEWPIEIPLNAKESSDTGTPLPKRGCNVEFADILVERAGQRWCTLGFESFGSLATVADDLKATAALLANRNPPEFPSGCLASYPGWLAGF